MEKERDIRFSSKVGKFITFDANRNNFERDRDRILYSTYFQRLNNVTQVISPDEGIIFHNRLTHSLKVAQIGRRLAEMFLRTFKDEKLNQILNPDVVEAAGLAHDLGHPPFGHAGEKTLNKMIEDIWIDYLNKNNKIDEKNINPGYEGNAQNFRIITRICMIGRMKFKKFGLDLIRATLNSILKYPWLRNSTQALKLKKRSEKKWCSYYSEREILNFVREFNKDNNNIDHLDMTLEAQIMEFADDISNAVHDLADFYRANIIPLDKLLFIQNNNLASNEWDDFLWKKYTKWITYLNNNKNIEFYYPENNESKNTNDSLNAIKKVKEWIYNILSNNIYKNNELSKEIEPIYEKYTGKLKQTIKLDKFVSNLIGYFFKELMNDNKLENLLEGKLKIPDDSKLLIEVLKSITEYYVHEDPELKRLQKGHSTIIKELFNIYYKVIYEFVENHNNTEIDLLPIFFKDFLLNELENSKKDNFFEYGDKINLCLRITSDIISSLSEQQAIENFKRLTGISSGSYFNRLIL